MDGVFTKSRWIWCGKSCPNQYVDFLQTFEADETADIKLRISADTNYALYVNGSFVYAGQYPDYPHYKIYDTFDISPYCVKGINRLAILCSYVGEDTSTYCRADAGLLFEVCAAGVPLAYSGSHTLCRADKCYQSGAIEKFSPQLGNSYHCDLRGEDGWLHEGAEGFSPATVVSKTCKMFPRPVRLLNVNDGLSVRLRAQGEFCLDKSYATDAEAAANAYLKHRTPASMGNPYAPVNRLPSEQGYALCTSGGFSNGVYALIDLGEEAAGFLKIDFGLSEDAKVIVAFGEHLNDLRVRSYIDGRNFSVTLRAKAGRNTFTGVMRRLGCRYLQIFVFAPRAVLYDCRILPTEYPIGEREVSVQDGMFKKIYECGVRTLRNCMHEHYEDCPWREQALYACDSRNQMLFGYAVFDAHIGRYAQANLRLMANGLREDGLLELCFPARVAVTIPSFSLYFILAVLENYLYTEDLAFAEEMLSVADKILAAFDARIDGTGLIPAFKEKEYWNFYEWKPGLDGDQTFRDYELPLRYDSCLNLLYLIVLQRLHQFYVKTGKKPKTDLVGRAARSKEAIERAFYVPEKKNFAISLENGVRSGFSQLALALAVAAGCRKEDVKEHLLMLKSEGLMQPMSCAFKLWLYEALLENGEENLAWVMEDILRTFGKMASVDTTLYETDLGADDFLLAGSLCHGWSAVGCYILSRYAKNSA